MEELINLIKTNDKGNIIYNGWINRLHIPTGLSHCPLCLILDNCWFNNVIKPPSELHEKCHCMEEKISKPIPNVNASAKCDIRKFRDYIFSDKYLWNGKRKLFEMLGFKKEDSEFLQKEYEEQAISKYCNSNYTLGNLDFRGQRINIDINFNKNGRQITFSSGWMVRPFGSITNNTPLGN